MSADLAAILADLPGSEPLPPGRLSRLQRDIITATAVVIYNSNDREYLDELTHQTVTRTAAYEATRRRHWPIDPQRSWEAQERSHRSSFDRAVATLLKRGYVNGLALAWVSVGHDEQGRRQPEDVVDWQGGGRQRIDPSGFRNREPVLKRIGLTDKGWRTVDVDGRPLGELLTSDGFGDTRATEIDFETQVAKLVARVAGGAS